MSKQNYFYQKKITGTKIIAALLVVIACWISVSLLLPILNLKKSEKENSPINLEKNTFKNLSYNFQDANGKEIHLHSSDVTEEGKDHFTINNMTGDFLLSNGTKVQIFAKKIIALTGKEKKGELLGDVRISLDSNLFLQTEHAYVNFDQKNAYGMSDIFIHYKDLKIYAKQYNFDMEQSVITLKKSIRGKLAKESSVFGDSLRIKFLEKNLKNLKKSQNHNQIIDNAQLKGHAKVKTQNFDLSSEQINYFGDKFEAENNLSLIYIRAAKKFYITSQKMIAKLDEAGNIKSINALGNLKIKEKDIIVQANEGFLKGNKIHLQGSVAITNIYGNIFGEQAELDLDTGNALIKKSSGVVEKK